MAPFPCVVTFVEDAFYRCVSFATVARALGYKDGFLDGAKACGGEMSVAAYLLPDDLEKMKYFRKVKEVEKALAAVEEQRKLAGL